MLFEKRTHGYEIKESFASVDELKESHVIMPPDWSCAEIQFARSSSSFSLEGSLEEWQALLPLVEKAIKVLSQAQRQKEALKDRELYADIVKRYGGLEQFKNAVENATKVKP